MYVYMLCTCAVYTVEKMVGYERQVHVHIGECGRRKGKSVIVRRRVVPTPLTVTDVITKPCAMAVTKIWLLSAEDHRISTAHVNQN